MNKRTWAAIGSIALTGLALAACTPAAESDELVLVFTPSVEADVIASKGDELAALLTEELGMTVTTFPVDTYPAAVTAFETGQAQIGMLAPALMVAAVDRAGAEEVLQVSRFGGSTYVTQWMTTDPDRFCLTDVVVVDGMSFCNGTDVSPASGPVGEDALELLTPDDAIAFVEADSASGYYFPVTQLIDLGVVMGPDDLTEAFFAGGHPDAVLALSRGEAVVGTSFNDARESVLEEVPTIGEDVVVFAWSADIPNDGIAVAGDLSDELKQAITDAFVSIASTEDGLAILDELYNVEALVPADLSTLDVVRQVVENFPDA